MTQPLHHMVRVRRTEDLTFVQPGLADEIVVNANQLENSVQSTAACLLKTGLPFTVDPVLWRFQVPAWWRNEKGQLKRNYRRLGAAYVRGTGIELAKGPLLETVSSDEDWVLLAQNAIAYQGTRLLAVPTQLDLLDEAVPRELRPVGFIAPALVAYSPAEDKVNRLLANASVTAAGTPIAAQLIVPADRLLDAGERQRLIAATVTEGISSYLIWTPGVSEELLLTDHDAFAAVLHLIAGLANRGVAVGHTHAGYTIAALSGAGISAVMNHLGWVDRGEPAEQQGFAIRSCQTYVPGVRHTVRFRDASTLGLQLSSAEYADRYCQCSFCAGAFVHGQHPLDLLLEDQAVSASSKRRMPTSRAVAANTWHYLLSRRLEIQAFSREPAADIVGRDLERASALAGGRDTARLRRLADELRFA
jgi:hypothetical protein